MRSTPLVLVLALLLSFNSFGQKIDSLLRALSASNHDTTRLKLLDAILEEQSSDYAIIEKYSLEMQSISTKNAENASGKLKKFYLKHYATALNNLAYVEENKSNTSGAIETYEKALAIFKEIDDKDGQAFCYVNLGYVAKKTGDLARAIGYYENGAALNKESGNKNGLFSAYNNLGVAFYAIGDIKKALFHYMEALKIAEELGDKKRQARIYNNISGVYDAQKEVKLYHEYQEKALKMAVESGEERGEAGIRVNQAVVFIENKQYDKARESALRVIEIAKKFNDKELTATGLSSLANVYRATGNLDEAVKTEKESLAIRTNMNSKNGMNSSYNSLGEIYFSFNKINEAIPYFKQSLEMSQQLSYPRGISRAAKNLSDCYKKQGNSAKAFEYYEQFVTMRDSVTNEDNRKATFKSQYKYEYEIKATADSIRSQGEKAVLTAQINQEKSQRYALTAAIILGVTLAGFAFYRFRVNQKMKELQLRNRIASDLHDEVGSAISSISLFAGLAKMKSGHETDDIILKIENTSRETVDNMSDIVWSIEPSNDKFDNVLKKMNYFGEQLMGILGINFTFRFEEGIGKTMFDMAKRKNIYLIYKEAVNNAAKYSGARNVNVDLTKDGRQYVMKIKDDGKGFDTNSSTLGNGLRNMKRRAEELNGTLTIESNTQGTLITLRV